MHVHIQVDGASHQNPGPAAIGVVVKDDQGKRLVEISQSIGVATNNVAEYKALITGLRKALSLGATTGTVALDSELAMRQLSGRYRVKSPGLQPLCAEATALLKKGRFTLTHVGHAGNHEAHELAQKALKGR